MSELLAGVDRVDVLQVDVEGYDAEAIRMFPFGRYLPSIVRFGKRRTLAGRPRRSRGTAREPWLSGSDDRHRHHRVVRL